MKKMSKSEFYNWWETNLEVEKLKFLRFQDPTILSEEEREYKVECLISGEFLILEKLTPLIRKVIKVYVKPASLYYYVEKGKYEDPRLYLFDVIKVAEVKYNIKEILKNGKITY